MSAKTSIEWTDRTWNPIRGCSVVSAGCKNCYAMHVAARFAGPGLAYEGLALRSPARWTGQVHVIEKDFDAPLHWRKPCRIFVNSMSDLFHESLPDEVIDRVVAVMAVCSSGATNCRTPDHDHDGGDCTGDRFAPHTFQVLTKRPERMRAYWAKGDVLERISLAINRLGWSFSTDLFDAVEWPLPNVWWGVSVENQEAADERIPHLLATPAAVRFLSVEPLLGPVVLPTCNGHWDCRLGSDHDEKPIGVDWVIVGGESGPQARPCDVAWIRSIVGQCKTAGVPCFVKQLGSRPAYDGLTSDENGVRWIHDRKGGDPEEWPEDLRVRELPR